MASAPATRAEKDRLLETFIALCEIPSPFGRERSVAETVTAELGEVGVEVDEDSSAARTGAECGNLLVRIGGALGPSVMLGAHLDTVPVEGPIEVTNEGGVLRNRHAAILGADNKAAVALLLEVARRYARGEPPIGIELLFTTSEENGLAGARAFDVASLRSPFGFVFDHATPIGELIVAAPTHYRVTGAIRGTPAHAGIRPEEGRSAIVAAARAVEAMSLGRLDDETTANVGRIAGGSATNVVAADCVVEAEARSLDDSKAAAAAGQLVDAMTWAAGTTETDVDTTVEIQFKGYRMPRSSPPVRAATAALRDCGVEPRLVATGGGSDANAFCAAGLPCVNLANGTEANHTPAERVSVDALELMLDVVHCLLARSAEVAEC